MKISKTKSAVIDGIHDNISYTLKISKTKRSRMSPGLRYASLK